MKKILIIILLILITIFVPLSIYSLYLKYRKVSVSESVDPQWVKEEISRLTSLQETFLIKKCLYKNRIVYYIYISKKNCYDCYESGLYTQNKRSICVPDGGFSGRGNGECPDFLEEKKDCLIIGVS